MVDTLLPTQVQQNQPLPVSKSNTLEFLIVSIVFLCIGGAGGYYLNAKNQNTTQTSSTQNLPQSSPTLMSAIIDPDGVDVDRIKPTTMNFSKKLYLDFDGDGQKEIVLIGTDTQHTASAQAGGPIEMPLIDVFRYTTVTKTWVKTAEINYLNFPTNTNGSAVSKMQIISLGKKEGLVMTSYVSGSRVNSRFEAIAGGSNGITAYSFPEQEYEAKGGKSPHLVDISVDGEISVQEGLYKPTDSNNSPTDGILKTVFKIDETGIHFVSTEKLPYNLPSM